MTHTFEVPDIKSGVFTLSAVEPPKSLELLSVKNTGNAEIFVWLGIANPAIGNHRFSLKPGESEAGIYKGQSIKMATKKGQGLASIQFEPFSK
ncbi:hypothetical protein NG798_00585 [Ancylothrix sp. C2]|nr:hypothetical protein [Ancylothrix sp. D3o]